MVSAVVCCMCFSHWEFYTRWCWDPHFETVTGEPPLQRHPTWYPIVLLYCTANQTQQTSSKDCAAFSPNWTVSPPASTVNIRFCCSWVIWVCVCVCLQLFIILYGICLFWHIKHLV